MLIIRQTEKGDKKVSALLDQALKSERFQLASTWFHCVQVDDGVLSADHPYHSLFGDRNPPRLVLASRKGAKVVSFLGTTGKKVSWSSIATVLKKDYKKDPTAAVKAIERLLSKFDALDSKRKELNSQLQRATKKSQKSKIKSIEAKLAKNDNDRTKAMAQKAKFEKLQLRSAEKTD